MSAADFQPEIWVMKRPGFPDVPFLVCARRWIRGDARPVKPDGGRPYDWIAHPVAISLTTPPFVAYGVRDDAAEWHRQDSRDHGFSDAAARAALAEAWRGVKEERLSLADMSLHISYDPVAARRYKGGTVPRNIIAWLRWDAWNCAGLTMEQRAAELTACGWPCTAKALKRAAEQRGL